MKKGDIFKIDQAAIVELENEGYSVVWKDKQKNVHRLTPGVEFAVTRTFDHIEVRASKFGDDGKPSKGRPRKFPTAIVARLLGEPMPVTPPSSDDLSEVEATTSGETVATVVSVPEPEPEPEQSEEDKVAQEQRVAELLGMLPDSGTGDDW